MGFSVVVFSVLLSKKLICSLAIVFALSACADREVEPEIYLIPEGYIGAFYIVYGVKSGLKPEYENGARLFQLSDTGVIHTQFSQNNGIGYPEMIRFFYVSEDGTRNEIVNNYGSAVKDTPENRDDKKIYIMSGGFGEFGFTQDTTARGCKYIDQSFYVGTLNNRLEGKENFRLEDYYIKHGYPCP